MILQGRRPDSSPEGVIVAHPGTQHSYETALAVQDAGLLRRYITGFYYKPEGAIGCGLRLLPASIRSKAERAFGRRHKDGLDPGRIQTCPALELVCAAARRLAASPGFTYDVRRWRNDWFDGLVARILAREEPAAVLCFNDCAQKTFRRAKSLNVLCILDQTIAHVRTALRLESEEGDRFSDFAEGPRAEAVEWIVARSSAELSLADLVLAGSEYVKTSLIEQGVDPARVVVMPYGVDTERFRPARRPADGAFRLLFVGQINRRKGIQYLLEAVKQLKLSGMELVLVGNPAGAEKGLARYRDYFTHVPNMPHDEVHTVFQRGDVFVYPSLHEGSALAIYEALASGLAVITTPNSGSVVRDGIDGFIVPIRDVEALKEKILLLYANTGLREEMARNARQRVEEFTWKAYRRRLGTLLQRLLFMRGRKRGLRNGQDLADEDMAYAGTEA